MSRKTAAAPPSHKARQRRAQILSGKSGSRQAYHPDFAIQAIPAARSSGALEVSQHNIAVGTVVRGHGSYFAFDHREVLLGEFPNLAEALRAFREIVFDEVMS